MSLQQFEIVPPGNFAKLFPMLLGGVLPVVIAAAMFLAAKDPRSWLVAAPWLILLPLIAGGLAWSMHHVRIEIEDGFFVLRRRLFPKKLAMAEIDLAQARIVDLNNQRELQPVLKISGSGLPGYRVGLFRLRNGKKGWLRLTAWQRVLVLPLHNGEFILLSPERPDAVLEALRRAG